MIKDLVIAILWSVSPFGEAKVGIPYGLLNGVNIYMVLAACFVANMLVFPIMIFFLNTINKSMLKWHFYKKSALFVARRAKTGSGNKIKKYGFYGLIFFVMLPLPGTGVYAGSIASYLFNFEKRKAFVANSIGIFLSSLIVWGTTLMTMKGMA